jgi:hypothetical protein
LPFLYWRRWQKLEAVEHGEDVLDPYVVSYRTHAGISLTLGVDWQ